MRRSALVLIALALSVTDAAVLQALKRMPALRMRGGAVFPAASFILAQVGPAAAAAPQATYALTNCAAGAAGFFGNVRIPAALLTGAALGQLWTTLDDKRGKAIPVIFTILTAFSIACELSVVFFSTVASTKMMGNAFDPMATSALALLVREFEFAFVSCRVHFCTGLLCFVAALGLRAWTAFPGNLGNSVAMLLVAIGFIMLNAFNNTVELYSFGLLGLIVRYVQLFFLQVISCPFGLAALTASGLSGYFLYKAIQEAREQAKKAH